MGVLRKISTYTITVKYSATDENDWEELQRKLAKVVGIHSVMLEKIEDTEKHCRGEWNDYARGA